MRLSRILMLIGALALPALPAAAQGKGVGKPAGVGKPTTTVVKGASGSVPKGKSVDAKGGTLVKGKSADATGGTLGKGNSADRAKGPRTTAAADVDTDTASGDAKGRGQLPLNEKIALNNTLKTKLEGLLAGGTMTFDQATTGWRNQGQLVAAMNVAESNNVSFAALHTEMTGPNQLSLGQALQKLSPSTTTDSTSTETTTTTTP